MRRVLLGTAAMIAFAAPAFAADMPARTYTKAPVYTPPEAIYNWTGFYIGGHVGGAFAGNNSLEGSGGRILGGLQGAFDRQFATNWGSGAEAPYSWPSKTKNNLVFPASPVGTTQYHQRSSVT